MAIDLDDFETPEELRLALRRAKKVNERRVLLRAVEGYKAAFVKVMLQEGLDPTYRGKKGNKRSAWEEVSSWWDTSDFDDYPSQSVFDALGEVPLSSSAAALDPDVVARLKHLKFVLPESASRGPDSSRAPLGPVSLFLSKLSHPTYAFTWHSPYQRRELSLLELDFEFARMDEEYPNHQPVAYGIERKDMVIVGSYNPSPGLILLDLVQAAGNPNPDVFFFDTMKPPSDLEDHSMLLSNFLCGLTASKGGSNWLTEL